MSLVSNLGELLLECERCHRQGTPMDGKRLVALEGVLRTMLFEEFQAHAEHLPFRDSHTKRVRWIKETELKLSEPHLRLWINCRDEADWLQYLLETLDRLLRRGTRRARAAPHEYAPPRLAEQVALLLSRGQPLDDPKQLVRDCLKHAIYDELRSAVRRAQNGGVRRVKSVTPTRPRRRDARMLARQASPASVLAAAVDAEDEVAFCLAYEYQAGGHARVVFAPFERLRLGTAPLGRFLDLVDGRFVADDEALARRAPGSTRRKPARLRGLGAEVFATLLTQHGLQFKASSIPKLYSRHSKSLTRRSRGEA